MPLQEPLCISCQSFDLEAERAEEFVRFNLKGLGFRALALLGFLRQ